MKTHNITYEEAVKLMGGKRRPPDRVDESDWAWLVEEWDTPDGTLCSTEDGFYLKNK